jgi:hypothetical protein
VAVCWVFADNSINRINEFTTVLDVFDFASLQCPGWLGQNIIAMIQCFVCKAGQPLSKPFLCIFQVIPHEYLHRVARCRPS